MNWRSLSSIFPWNKSRNTSARLRLTQAYQSVFKGSPSREDQELVLSDLANTSGFYRVSPSSMATDVLRQQEGKRELYAHVFGFLNLNPSDVQALESAARREAAVDQQLTG